MRIVLFVCVVGLLALSGCRDRMTCPEYQSRYILDEEYRQAMFAVFDQDTLPIYDANEEPNRTWYGTVGKKNFFERKREIETVRMEKVFAKEEPVDTATFDQSDFLPNPDSALATTSDSTGTGVVTPTPEESNSVDIASTGSRDIEYAIVTATDAEDKTYNVEQRLYMMYVGHEVMKRRQAAYDAWQKAEAERLEEERIKDSTRFARRERFFGFFRKKEKVEEVVEEVYDPFADDEDIPLPAESAPVQNDTIPQGQGNNLPPDEEEDDPDQDN